MIEGLGELIDRRASIRGGISSASKVHRSLKVEALVADYRACAVAREIAHDAAPAVAGHERFFIE